MQRIREIIRQLIVEEQRGILAEAKESPIDVARRVVKNKQSEKVDGMLLDLTTANAIVTVYNAIGSKNQKHMSGLSLKQIVNITWKLVGRK